MVSVCRCYECHSFWRYLELGLDDHQVYHAGKGRWQFINANGSLVTLLTLTVQVGQFILEVN